MKSFSSSLIFKKWHLQFALIFTGLVIIGGFFLFLPEIDAGSLIWVTVGWLTLNVALLWIGNAAINQLLNRVFPWLTFGTTRFFTQLFAVLFYSLIVINALYFSFKGIFTSEPPTDDQVIVMNAYGTVVIVLVTSIYFGISFLKSWRRSELEAEKMQKEHVKSQLKALQNHLDPHFLFNNLNILSSLIDKDAKQSKEFLDRFAEVYRTLLKKEMDDLVLLSDELEFLETYTYLIKVRFEENIAIKQEIPETVKGKFLPPMTLQMLLENAIKHNKITESKPLNVAFTINEEKMELVVTNNLQPKQSQVESERTGLDNIKNRYKHFTDRKVVIEESEETFTVRLPLIEVQG
ncbi:MAG: histidine kinase [Cyclobacteriaceae bacterium]